MIFILPVGVERTLSRKPVVTYYLIGINFLVFIYTFFLSGDPRSVILEYGLIPSRLSVLTFFTSMFLHGGIGHILGNMLFLYLYGGNMEDRLGRARYLALYFVGGLAADALYIAVTSGGLESDIPMVGASGAISAVLGAFLLSFPRVKIRFFYFLWPFFCFWRFFRPYMGHFRVVAWLVLGFWFLKQAFFGAATASMGSGIAFFAHIGGFVFGIFAALANEKLEKKETTEEEQRQEEGVFATKESEGQTERVAEQVGPLRLRVTEPVGEIKMPEDEKKAEGKQEAPEEGQEEVVDEWKVRFKDGTVFAPVTYDQLVEWCESGQIDEDSPVAKNVLTAEWVAFKETEGFAVAEAKKEGQQIFCSNCGSPWPVGTTFCTKCGTNLETGEKMLGVGEKPADTVKLRGKAAAAPPEAPSEPAAAAEVAEAPAAEVAVEAAEAAEVVAPAKPRKRGKKMVIKLAVAAGVVVAALAVLAPDQMSAILEKVKGVFGGKGGGPKQAQEESAKWAGVSEGERSAIEPLQQHIAKALGTVPFASQRRTDFNAEVGDFLRVAANEFSDADVFGSVTAALMDGSLREAASLLEEEKGRIGSDYPTPMMDAILGSVEVLLGRKEGLELLASAVEDVDVAQVAASFCRGAVEGCLDRLLLEQGKKDPWGTVAEILGITKEDIGDEFLASHSGRALAGLATVRALTGESPGAKKGRIRTKAFLRFFGRGNPSVQAALVELGQKKPREGSSILKHESVRVAYALRIFASEQQQETSEQDDGLVNLLREGVSAHPENSFYNYALAAAYMRENKVEEASAEIKAGNEKPAYQDFRKERMEGMAKIVDTLLPYTAAAMSISSSHVSALATSSRGLLDKAASFFRVGRRDDSFKILGEWRKMCERLRGEASTLADASTTISVAIPLMAAQAAYYKRDGEQVEAWRVRKALVEAERIAMAIRYTAAYGATAVILIKEVFSDEGYQEEFSRTSPRDMLAGILSKANERLDAMLKQDPASVPLMGVNLQDLYYAQAKQALDENRYERAYEFGYGCLAQNPGHLWAFKIMEDAVKRKSAMVELEGPRPVAYMELAKRDMSTPVARRVLYELEVARGTTKEAAAATVRTALQGFLRREKPDAVRIYLGLEGSRLPLVRLDWAPGGDWDKARAGTPYAEFEENLTVF